MVVFLRSIYSNLLHNSLYFVNSFDTKISLNFKEIESINDLNSINKLKHLFENNNLINSLLFSSINSSKNIVN